MNTLLVTHLELGNNNGSICSNFKGIYQPDNLKAKQKNISISVSNQH